MRTNQDRRDQYARNRAAGMCSCGNAQRPDGRTCQRCYDAGIAARARIKKYATEHGVTWKAARAAVATRQWSERRPPRRCATCNRTNCRRPGNKICQLHARIGQLERKVELLKNRLRHASTPVAARRPQKQRRDT